MKYFLRVLIVIVGAFAVICAAYYGIHGNLPIKPEAPETTITKPAATEKHSDKEILASLPSEKIFLYKTKTGVLLSVDNKMFEFNNWSRIIDATKPEIICEDFDNDNQNEILIKAAEYKDSDGKFIDCIYYLDPIQGEKLDYSVLEFNKESWERVLDETLTEQVSQLKLSKKMAQFALNYKKSGITYDKETGISIGGYAGYFEALCDDNKNYYTIDSWKKGSAEYIITENNRIFIDIPILVSYKETSDVQLAGKINFGLMKGKDGDVKVVSKSLTFTPNDDYIVSDPTQIAEESWSYTEINSDTDVDESKDGIDWVKYKTAFDPTITTQTLSFASTSTDIKNVSELTLTESSIKLVAKPNCSFDNSYKTGEYSVIINEGLGTQYDISYTAELSKDKNGNEVLTINFDKPYPQDQIRTITINYGAK